MSEKSDPAVYASPITPSDTLSLNIVTRALYVGGTGDVCVVMEGGSNKVVFESVQAGSVLPIQINAVRATKTTATALVALF